MLKRFSSPQHSEHSFVSVEYQNPSAKTRYDPMAEIVGVRSHSVTMRPVAARSNRVSDTSASGFSSPIFGTFVGPALVARHGFIRHLAGSEVAYCRTGSDRLTDARFFSVTSRSCYSVPSPRNVRGSVATI